MDPSDLSSRGALPIESIFYFLYYNILFNKYQSLCRRGLFRGTSGHPVLENGAFPLPPERIEEKGQASA
jgi:hypothetical protein